MRAYTTKELKAILKLHQKWLNNEVGGTRANLTYANLTYADLTDANLSRANLTDANLTYANLAGADLTDANLSRANLTRANLTRANLAGANLTNLLGDMEHIKTLQTDKYLVSYTNRVLQIGCKKYSIEEWKNFDDKTISQMDSGALEWWTQWKPIIMQIIEMSPCEPTK